MNNGINTRNIAGFTIICLLVFLPGLLVDVLNIDAAQYATMSRQMSESGQWLQVHENGNDYLDKPPLLFWLSAASFKIFGISNWAYKLPSFLFALLGIYSTFRIGELLYDKKTGAIAGLMLTFSVGMFVMANDVRTDTVLLGTTIFATWQLLLYIKTKRWRNLILGFAGVGLAMLAKGPLGIVLPATALSCEFAYRRQWKNFVRWQWIPGLLIVALLLFPMCYGLYQQFDLHPEKVINGHTNTSGLRFYFWTQSFGRITGESDWGSKFDNGAGPFFFTHTFLWAFFPWSFFLVCGLFKNLVVLVKSRFKSGYLPEVLSTGGFVLVFIALSASRYKLPHYIFVLLPLAAIISSRFLLHDVLDPAKKYLYRISSIFHWLFFAALAFVSGYFLFVVFPDASVLTIVAASCLLIAGMLFAWKLDNPFEKLVYPLLAGMLVFYFIADSHFYPRLMKYQSGNEVGRMLADKKVPAENFYTYIISDHALNFYSGKAVHSIGKGDTSFINNSIAKQGSLWLYTDEEGHDDLVKNQYHIISEKAIEDYHVQFVTTNFLNPSTRPESLRHRFLLQINKAQE